MINESKKDYIEKKGLHWEKSILNAGNMIYKMRERKTFNLEVQKKKTLRRRHLATVERLKKLGVKLRNGRSSLYINGLSPGCISCTAARGFTLNFGDNCNRSCFYCYQPRPQPLKRETVPFPIIEGLIRKEYERADRDSFAISGGEPLFHIDKVYRALLLVKKLTNNKCQTRLYTNGDLLTLSILKKLRTSGLDEIRFGFNEQDINFDKIAQAKRYIPRVMMEIPVLPDDEKGVRKILIKVNKMRIFGINLKEFNYTGNNTDIFRSKGYFLKTRQLDPKYFEGFDQHPLYPIYGSEEVCFNLMEFVAKRNFSISVHYCSTNNKKYAYLQARRRYFTYLKKPHEAIARNGLLKTVAIYFPEHRKAYKDLERNNVPADQIVISNEKGKLVTHPNNLKFLNKDSYTISMLYYINSSMDGMIDIKILNPKTSSH